MQEQSGPRVRRSLPRSPGVSSSLFYQRSSTADLKVQEPEIQGPGWPCGVQWAPIHSARASRVVFVGSTEPTKNFFLILVSSGILRRIVESVPAGCSLPAWANPSPLGAVYMCGCVAGMHACRCVCVCPGERLSREGPGASFLTASRGGRRPGRGTVCTTECGHSSGAI